MKLKRYERAESNYKKSIIEWKKALSTKQIDSNYRLQLEFENLTDCYAEQGKLVEAKSSFKRLAVLVEESSDAYVNLTDLTRKLNQLGLKVKNPRENNQ